MSDRIPENNGQEVKFGIQRIYVKDSSLESPKSPQVFTEQWQPNVEVQVASRSEKVGDKSFEVALRLTVMGKKGDDNLFCIEVEQAGLFEIEGAPGDQLAHMLGAFCPNILFPYAREHVDSLAMKATFPPLHLAPVNFDALYQEELRKRQTQ